MAEQPRTIWNSLRECPFSVNDALPPTGGPGPPSVKNLKKIQSESADLGPGAAKLAN